jgi:serine phosphatase RsbU (regulator of sigma subunit)
LHHWLVGALLWSVPMAYYAMRSGNRPESLYPLFYANCGLIVAFLGMMFCLRSYSFIRKKSLYWRHMALLSAAVAAIPSIITSLDAVFPSFITDPAVVDTVNTLHFNSGFMLALSAFFNISSLENRVKALSIVQMKAKQLEMELELARSVQKQHMRMPKMPDEISVECFQSAASYVSGDTYFLDWNEKTSVFTFVLNDVTGHGVQAALKATICNVIAELVWVKGAENTIKDNSEFSIARYSQLICKYLSERFHANDLHSICGGEFNLEKGELCLYRSNAPSPLILQPSSIGNDQGQKYDVLTVPLLNQTVSKIQLRPGAMVIVMSDGILFSSREQANIARRLSEMVSVTNPDELSLEQVRETITATNLMSNQSIDDDKTLLIFRWNPRRAKIKPFKIAG